MDVVFFKSGVEFLVDEECGVAAQTKLPESLFKNAEAAAQRGGISMIEFFEQAVREKIELLETSKPAPKIPRGFVLINLSEWEKKELRDLARESGMELRTALKHALIDVRVELKDWARVKRLTGLKPYELPGCLNRLDGHSN
jgi:hypothetical protein